MLNTSGCRCEIGPGNNITLIRFSEARSEAWGDLFQPAPCRSEGAEMVRDCLRRGPLLIEADVDCESHTRSWKVTLDRWRQVSPPAPPVPSSAFYLMHCCSGSSAWSFVIWFSAGEMQSSPETGNEGVITMGCLSWWERGGGCGWKMRMIGCFQKWFVWKTTKAACTWDSKEMQRSKNAQLWCNQK